MTREEAIKTLKGEAWSFGSKEYREAFDMAVKALEQEPVYFPPCVDCNTKMNEIREAYDRLKNQEPCEDAISKKSLLARLRLNYSKNQNVSLQALVDILNTEPPVTPKRKVGEWIYHEKSISTGFKSLRECSCCHCYFKWEMPRNSYCPNCGSDMRGGEE